MVADPVFWKAVSNNVVYAFTTIPLSMGLALAMALLDQCQGQGAGAGADGVLHADGAADGGVANIWLFFYAPDYGLIDQLLRPFGRSAETTGSAIGTRRCRR